jgi:hypothetical protein
MHRSHSTAHHGLPEANLCSRTNTEFRHVFLSPPDRHASSNDPTNFFPVSPATNWPALDWSADHLFPICHGELYDLSERFSRSTIP